ncbi:MAG: hypothetical protein U9N14_03845, partial [Pseudomonadota bacterium]|nr:hypothetical protein [Pseudomonadota bacterium]
VESRAGMALVAELLARLHKDDGQTGKAWAFFKRARNQHGKLHDEPSVGQATRDMEQVKTLDSDRSGRSNRLKNAVLARRIKARLDIAEARQTIGYRDEARDMLCECLAMARDDDFKNLGPFILTDLGAALTDIGMAEEGGDVLSVAAGTAKARGRGPYVLAQIAAKQGKAALQSDQVKEANVHYARATGLYRDARRPELAGTMLMEIARIHAASECYDLADRAANGALILFLEAGEIDRAVMTYGEMADFARTDDRLFDALAYTNKATALEHVAFPPPKPDGP